jgi:REP element-mobilizing transposase RayT
LDNHIHLLVAAEQLSKIIKEFKSFTAREIIHQAKKEKKGWLLSQLAFHKKRYGLDSNYQVWQEGFHPKMITSDEMLEQKAAYIHQNPVRIGLVTKEEDWFYSSAGNFLGLPGPLEIDAVEG